MRIICIYAHIMRILSVGAHNMSGRHIRCRGAIMRGNDICAENAHVRRQCAFGVYYARMRILRRLCADAHSAQLRICTTSQYAQRQSPSRKGPECCISLCILEGESESSKRQRFPGTYKGKVCLMKIAKHAPATRCTRAQQEFARPRA